MNANVTQMVEITKMLFLLHKLIDFIRFNESISIVFNADTNPMYDTFVWDCNEILSIKSILNNRSQVEFDTAIDNNVIYIYISNYLVCDIFINHSMSSISYGKNHQKDIEFFNLTKKCWANMKVIIITI